MSDQTKPAGDPFALQPETIEAPAPGAPASAQTTAQPQPTAWGIARELIETIVL